jgi:hypothetical protein
MWEHGEQLRKRNAENKKVEKKKEFCDLSVVPCPRTWQFFRLENQHPPAYTVTSADLRDTIKGHTVRAAQQYDAMV